MEKSFKENVKESLKCYVYALVDPRDKSLKGVYLCLGRYGQLYSAEDI